MITTQQIQSSDSSFLDLDQCSLGSFCSLIKIIFSSVDFDGLGVLVILLLDEGVPTISAKARGVTAASHASFPLNLSVK